MLLVVAAVSLIADAAGAASKMLLVWGVCGGADVSTGGVGISCCSCGSAPKGYDRGGGAAPNVLVRASLSFMAA